MSKKILGILKGSEFKRGTPFARPPRFARRLHTLSVDSELKTKSCQTYGFYSFHLKSFRTICGSGWVSRLSFTRSLPLPIPTCAENLSGEIRITSLKINIDRKVTEEIAYKVAAIIDLFLLY